MSIESSAFGVTRLTKKDAEKFKNQVSFGRTPQEAKDSFKQGKSLLNALDTKGTVSVRVKK